jgi:hypothetical protein
MSSSFCNLEEAFTGPVLMQPGGDKKVRKDKSGARSKDRQFEQFVPVALPAQPDPDRAAPLATAPSPMTGAPSQAVLSRLESTDSAAAAQFFPLPGDSADSEEWQKAFMLEGSAAPVPAPALMANGAIPVDGKSTLWRQIPQPAVAAGTILAPGAIPAEISARLDQLTRQLENLTGPAPMQSTAELFLFVAIGLLLLLALDTLLRFASGAKRMRGGGGGVRMPYQWPAGRRVWIR